MRKGRTSPMVYPTPREMTLTGRDVRVDRAVIVIPKGATRRERFPAELFRRWVADEFLVNIPVCEGAAPRGKKKRSQTFPRRRKATRSRSRRRESSRSDAITRAPSTA